MSKDLASNVAGKWIGRADNREFDGCLCERIKDSSKDRIEAWIEAKGGGKPGSDLNFGNVILTVNEWIEFFLDRIDTLPPTKAKAKRAGAVLER